MKTDLGELGADEALYHNGMDGKEGHNFYTLAYQRVVFEATQEVRGEEEAMIWCRSGYIGSQKYPVHWAGDVKCDYENMAGQLRALLGAGMSGFPFFSHDIGGFVGDPPPTCLCAGSNLACFRPTHAFMKAGGVSPGTMVRRSQSTFKRTCNSAIVFCLISKYGDRKLRDRRADM